MENIIKRRKTANYTQINNHPIQDDLGDLAAIGLLTYIMSLPEDWVLYKTKLQSKFSRRKVDSAWKILVEKNYAIGFSCYVNGKKNYFYIVSDIPFTQNDFDDFVKETVDLLKNDGNTIFNVESINDSPLEIPEEFSNVQNVQYKMNSSKRTYTKEINTKEKDTNKHLLSIDNYQESQNTFDETSFKKTFTNTCNDFYSQFAPGRWTKKQWNAMIKKFVGEIIESGRYKKIPIDKMKGYAFKAISNMADHNDYKNSAEFAEYQNAMREVSASKNDSNTSGIYNWLED